MSGIKTIPSNATIDTNKEQFQYTLVRLKRNPYTSALVPEFQAFEPKLDAAEVEEEGLCKADAEAGASVQFADDDLDLSVDFVTGNVDRKSLLGGRLFGDLRPSEVKRPVLGGQLKLMKNTWPDAIATSTIDVLKAHVPLLVQRIQAGTAAESEKEGTSNKLTDFRTIGGRVKLNEDHNALRKALFGKLSDIQHAKGLASDWAESFFQQDSTEALSANELDRRIAAMEVALESLKGQRDALKQQESTISAAKANAARKVKKAKLDAITKSKADLEAKESALRAELDTDAGDKDGSKDSKDS